MPYKRKTRDNYISNDLKNVLNDIKTDSLVAKLLLKNRLNKDLLVDNAPNYIVISDDDPNKISYLTPDRIEKFDESEFWKRNRRYHAKPGGFVNKLFKGIDNKEIEKFSNLYKAEMETKLFEFKVVKGKGINYYYHYTSYLNDEDGSLGISCMKHDKCQSYFDIYTENSDVISMLVMIDKRTNKLIGRALLWDIDDFKFMDRIYAINDERYSSHFKKWAVKNGYYHKSKQSWYNTLNFERFGKSKVVKKLKLKLKNINFDNYPYLDTFKIMDNDGYLYNYIPDNLIKSEYKSMIGIDGEYLSQNELRFDENRKEFIYGGDSIFLDYKNGYFLASDTYYSSLNSLYIHQDDCIYNDKIGSYIFNDMYSHLNNEIKESVTTSTSNTNITVTNQLLFNARTFL
jgi:hypothetical protein